MNRPYVARKHMKCFPNCPYLDISAFLFSCHKKKPLKMASWRSSVAATTILNVSWSKAIKILYQEYSCRKQEEHTIVLSRGVAKPLWLRGVHWIARICYFYKIARILLDALTTTNVATCDRISPYFARIFPVFKNFWVVWHPHRSWGQ